jgi:hypothetical protein
VPLEVLIWMSRRKKIVGGDHDRVWKDADFVRTNFCSNVWTLFEQTFVRLFGFCSNLFECLDFVRTCSNVWTFFELVRMFGFMFYSSLVLFIGNAWIRRSLGYLMILLVAFFLVNRWRGYLELHSKFTYPIVSLKHKHMCHDQCIFFVPM